LTFGKANRTGAMRIPAYVSDPAMVRVEYRPPDASCNPYLCLATILMAGIDGIARKIDPEERGFGPFDGSGDDVGKEIEMLPGSLTAALDALEKDYEFLLRGGVFDEALIEHWVEIKRNEVKEQLQRPHPYEFEKYFEF